MALQLHEIWPAGAYCGPSVLAALTGAEAKPGCRAWINAVRGRPANRGVLGLSNRELLATLASRGYAVAETFIFQRRHTLAQFAAEHPDGFFICNVTKHYVALCNGRAADNHVRFGCPVAEHPSARAWVRKAWRIQE